MKLLLCIYHWFYNYYNNTGSDAYVRIRAFISFCGVLFFNAIAVLQFVDLYFFNCKIPDYYFTYDAFTRRFIIAPLVISPIFIITYVVFYFNKKSISVKLSKFSKETETEVKKRNKRVYLYFLLTFIFILLSFWARFHTIHSSFSPYGVGLPAG